VAHPTVARPEAGLGEGTEGTLRPRLPVTAFHIQSLLRRSSIARGFLRAYTRAQTLAIYPEPNNSALGIGFALLRNISSFAATPVPHPPPAAASSSLVRVPFSITRLGWRVFAVALNGGENRSDVNARGSFATPMKTLFSDVACITRVLRVAFPACCLLTHNRRVRRPS